jgi:glycosyltransferase involved in cell wall biosynthesis
MELLGAEYELCVTGKLTNIPLNARLSSNIVELGYLSSVSDIVAAYQNCDALLFPTRLEGFGLVALEAQACGLPVITTNVSSLPEVVEDQVSGLLCPPDDVLAFADAIRRLRDDYGTWSKMCVAARERAVNLFSESAIVDKYISIYSRLI